MYREQGKDYAGTYRSVSKRTTTKNKEKPAPLPKLAWVAKGGGGGGGGCGTTIIYWVGVYCCSSSQ